VELLAEWRRRRQLLLALESHLLAAGVDHSLAEVVAAVVAPAMVQMDLPAVLAVLALSVIFQAQISYMAVVVQVVNQW
jgi:hypothetical protein